MEKRSGTLTLVDPRPREIAGHVIGSLVGGTREAPLVSYPDNAHGPLPARSSVALPADEQGAVQACELLLVFDGQRSDRPIIVGVLNAAQQEQAAAIEAPREVQVDGKRVVLDAKDEIVLRCGKASITLRRNGRVVIRGAYVETRSEGVNRVKGGAVKIN